MVVPATIGSHEDLIGTPDSCSLTVGRSFSQPTSALGGSVGFVMLAAGKITEARAVGDGRSRLPAAVTQALSSVRTWV